jgi:hypothetical protein
MPLLWDKPLPPEATNGLFRQQYLNNEEKEEGNMAMDDGDLHDGAMVWEQEDDGWGTGA